MVVKVDFDLTMSILAFNLYRLLAKKLVGFTNSTAQSLYDKFIHNSGEVEVKENQVYLELRKKRNLPALMEALEQKETQPIQWIHGRYLNIRGASYS